MMPHCVVCGFSSGAEVAGSVRFADYNPDIGPPHNAEGYPLLGWTNSLGVTAPEGVGLFCADHLKAAKKLRRLPADEGVELLRMGTADRQGFLARLRRRLG